ncbi:UNVERIFIED_CONTAM: hypothetical protein Sindi_2889600 [Sesamum indicum]
MDGDGGDDGGDEGCDEEGVQTTDTRCPTLGFASAKSSGSHGEHGSISFNIPEFSKLANTVLDAGDKQALDALRELNYKWTERFGEEATTRCFPPSREAITTPFLPRVLRPPVKNIRRPVRRVENTETPDRKPLEPAVDWSQPPSMDARQLVAEYVSNTGYVASENWTAEMAEDGALDLVHNNAVNVEQNFVNNDPVKIDLVNKDAVNVKIVEQDLVNDDLVNGELVNTDAVNVNVVGEKDKDKDVDAVNSNDIIGFGRQRTYETNSTHTGLFIENIPLQSCPIPGADDKIVDGFNNSSSSMWKTTAVGYFLEKRPYFYHIQEYAMSVWPGLRDVKATTNGFYFFQFKTVAYMEEAIEGGPWLFQGQPIVPAWIKLRHLSVELWTEEGLSMVASGIGRPLYPNAITRACTRLDFARVCVMLDVSSKLPRHIIIIMPNEEGGEIPCKIDVEYEWLPPYKLYDVRTYGKTKPPVSVYVPKTVLARSPPMHDQEKILPTQGVDNQREGRELPCGESCIPKTGPARPPPMHDQKRISPTQGVDNQREGREHDQERMLPTQVVDNQREGREPPRERRLSREEKGKAIIVYNTYDALQLLDDAEDTPRGHIPSPETGIQTLHHVLTSFGRRAISDD